MVDVGPVTMPGMIIKREKNSVQSVQAKNFLNWCIIRIPVHLNFGVLNRWKNFISDNSAKGNPYGFMSPRSFGRGV